LFNTYHKQGIKVQVGKWQGAKRQVGKLAKKQKSKGQKGNVVANVKIDKSTILGKAALAADHGHRL